MSRDIGKARTRIQGSVTCSSSRSTTAKPFSNWTALNREPRCPFAELDVVGGAVEDRRRDDMSRSAVCQARPMDLEPRLFVITGIMAAGKSTVAQALAERFDRSVHLRGDLFRRAVVSGRVDMSSEPSIEATTQLALRYELAAMCADRYVEAGFVTVVQDVMLGPTIVDVMAMFHTRPLALVVLAPTAQAVATRERERDKIGYHHFSPAELDADLRDRTPRLGLWIDTTEMTVDATVQHIIDNQTAAIVDIST